MKKLLVISTLFFAAACGQQKQNSSDSELNLVKPVTPVHASNGIEAWNTQIRKNAAASGVDLVKEGYSECAAVVEVKGSYLCGSMRLQHMNEALARASIFVEGLFGTPKHTVVDRKNPAYTRSISSIGGHDLTSEDLQQFWDAVTIACENGSKADFCTTGREKEFFETFVLPKFSAHETFVVVSYALSGSLSWQETVTHEMMHAQYFLEPKFRETADLFWQDQVSEADKKTTKQLLGRIYDVENELLLKNEFQAYILMTAAERNQLRSLVPKYRKPLTQALEAAGIHPLQIR